MANRNLVKLIDRFITIETEPVNNSALWDIVNPDEKIRLMRTIIEAALYIETLGQNSITNKILDVVLKLETSSVDLETGEVTISKTYNINDILSYPTGVLSWMIDNGKKEGDDGKPIDINSDGFLPREATFWIDAILRLGTYWFETGYTPSTRPKGDGDITFSDSPNSNVTWKKDENNIWMPNDVLAILRNSHFYIWTKNEIEYAKKRGFTGGFVTMQEFDALKKLVDEYSNGIVESVKTAKFGDESLTTTQSTKAEAIVSIEDKKIRILAEANKIDIDKNTGNITKLNKGKINAFEDSNILHPSTHKKEDGKIINSDIYNRQLLTDNKWGKGAINENFKKIETNTEKIETNTDNIIDKFIRFMDDNSDRSSIKFDPNSFAVNGGYELYATNIWSPLLEGKNGVNFILATRKMVEGKINGLVTSNEKIIVELNPNFFGIGIKNNLELIEPTDFKNNNLKGINKTGVAAINWIYDLAMLNEENIFINTQGILRNINLIELIFELINSKIEAYVKSYTIEGTYYEPTYVATAKGKNEVSDPSIIDQISNKEHKIFSGFNADLGVTAVIVINESSVGDVKFTLLKDGKKVSETITKTLTGKKMRLKLVFKKYPIIDDKKDHIYMILSEGVKGAWYNIAYLGLEFTILGAGGGTGGDVTLTYVNSENNRQDREYQLKLDNKLNIFHKATDLMDTYFAVDTTTGKVYATEFWNRAIGGDATKYILTTRRIVDEDRVKIDYINDKLFITTKSYMGRAIEQIQGNAINDHHEYKFVTDTSAKGHYYHKKNYGYSIKETWQNPWQETPILEIYSEYEPQGGPEWFGRIDYFGRYENMTSIATKSNIVNHMFLLKKEIYKLKVVKKTDDEIVNEVLDEIDNSNEINELFIKHIKLRKKKREKNVRKIK